MTAKGEIRCEKVGRTREKFGRMRWGKPRFCHAAPMRDLFELFAKGQARRHGLPSGRARLRRPAHRVVRHPLTLRAPPARHYPGRAALLISRKPRPAIAHPAKEPSARRHYDRAPPRRTPRTRPTQQLAKLAPGVLPGLASYLPRPAARRERGTTSARLAR